MKETLQIVLGLVVLLVLYVGAYTLNLEGGNVVSVASGEMDVRPGYRFGGAVAETVFWPVFVVDQKLRPQRWEQPWPEVSIDLPIDETAAPAYPAP